MNTSVSSKQVLTPNDLAAGSGAEWGRIYAALEVTPEWELENIKQTAMARNPSKKGRQPHIKKILDEAFNLLAEHAQT